MCKFEKCKTECLGVLFSVIFATLLSKIFIKKENAFYITGC